MTQAERRLYLIQALKDERKEYRNLEIPQSADGQRRLLRSLMNVRAPGAVRADLLAVQDEYLRQALAEDGVTRAEDLRPACGDLFLWQGNITRLACGAIVNAANSGMTGCYIPGHAGIDNCIHTYAGMQLRQACADSMARQGGEEPVGQAKITKAYNLPCRYVHAYRRPHWWRAASRRRTSGLLAACYRACLALAEQSTEWRASRFAASPPGSSTSPTEKRAAEIAVQTVRRAQRAQRGSGMEVIFNVFKEIGSRRSTEELLRAD